MIRYWLFCVCTGLAAGMLTVTGTWRERLGYLAIALAADLVAFDYFL